MKLYIGYYDSPHSFQIVERETNKILKEFSGACNMPLRIDNPFKDFPKDSLLRSAIKVYNAAEVKDTFSFLDYLFSKEYSPYRDYLDHVVLVRDSEGNPIYIECTDITKTNCHAFCNLIASVRLARECPGSMTVFVEALRQGAEPHVAYIIANIFSANVVGTSFDVSTLIRSPYAEGWHTPISYKGNYFPLLVKNPKPHAPIDDHGNQSLYKGLYLNGAYMCGPFIDITKSGNVTNKNSFHYQELFKVNKNNFDGIVFKKLYERMRQSMSYKDYAEKNPLPIKDMIEFINSKSNA